MAAIMALLGFVSLADFATGLSKFFYSQEALL